MQLSAFSCRKSLEIVLYPPSYTLSPKYYMTVQLPHRLGRQLALLFFPRSIQSSYIVKSITNIIIQEKEYYMLIIYL